MSDLVVNPQDKFSHDVAHFILQKPENRFSHDMLYLIISFIDIHSEFYALFVDLRSAYCMSICPDTILPSLT